MRSSSRGRQDKLAVGLPALAVECLRRRPRHSPRSRRGRTRREDRHLKFYELPDNLRARPYRRRRRPYHREQLGTAGNQAHDHQRQPRIKPGLANTTPSSAVRLGRVWLRFVLSVESTTTPGGEGPEVFKAADSRCGQRATQHQATAAGVAERLNSATARSKRQGPPRTGRRTSSSGCSSCGT
jgi:hypothetical protein